MECLAPAERCASAGRMALVTCSASGITSRLASPARSSMTDSPPNPRMIPRIMPRQTARVRVEATTLRAACMSFRAIASAKRLVWKSWAQACQDFAQLQWFGCRVGLIPSCIPPCMKDVCFRGDVLVKDERQPVDVQPWLAKCCGRPERERRASPLRR